MPILDEISVCLQRGSVKEINILVPKALEEGIEPQTVLNDGLLSGMSVVGEKFKNNEIFIPEVMIAARAMKAGTDILRPYLTAEKGRAAGKVCLGTVKGDRHDIGKNLVKIMLEGKGLEVIDLGVDVAPERFVETAIKENCRVIGCSALLTTTMGVMKDVVSLCEKEGIRNRVKIMIGGAPVSEDFCREIGADAYTPDAASAADKALEFCSE
ncbi:MAG: corrinoid protein [Firmicutes bacterium]|nr:corrinoid protein [Bacillota bacterium]